MDFADRNGIVIIDECPAVALDHFEAPLLAHHLSVMTDLVGRDKNHPSVVMWSVGNEPKSYRSNAGTNTIYSYLYLFRTEARNRNILNFIYQGGVGAGVAVGASVGASFGVGVDVGAGIGAGADVQEC